MAINTHRHRVQREWIVTRTLPNAVRRFLDKNQDYGFANDDFGEKAQIIDISRKYKKLKSAIWDGEELTGESIEEVAEDLIGHLLLLLEMRSHVQSPPTGQTHSHLVDYKEGIPCNPTWFTSQEWSIAYHQAMATLFEPDEESEGEGLNG